MKATKINTGIYESKLQAHYTTRHYSTSQKERGCAKFGTFVFNIEKTDYTGEMSWKVNFEILNSEGECVFTENDCDYYTTKKQALQAIANQYENQSQTIDIIY